MNYLPKCSQAGRSPRTAPIGIVIRDCAANTTSGVLPENTLVECGGSIIAPHCPAVGVVRRIGPERAVVCVERAGAKEIAPPSAPLAKLLENTHCWRVRLLEPRIAPPEPVATELARKVQLVALPEPELQ